LFLPIIAYTLSTTKLEIRAKQFLLGIDWVRRRGIGRGGGRGEKMTQALYAHMNKKKRITNAVFLYLT
jgi:hypothetical protein